MAAFVLALNSSQCLSSFLSWILILPILANWQLQTFVWKISHADQPRTHCTIAMPFELNHMSNYQ